MKHLGPAQPEASSGAHFELDFDLSGYLNKLRRHWRIMLLAVLVCMVVSSIRFNLTPEVYQASARLQIQRRSINPLVGAGSPWMENWWNMEFYPTQYRLLESRRTARDAATLLIESGDLDPPAGWDAEMAATEATFADDDLAMARVADGLRGGLQVVPVRSTQLVDLTYRSADPEFAYKAANAFAAAFRDWSNQERRDTAVGASRFLGDQLEDVRQEIADKESRLREISSGTQSIALDPQSNVLLQRLEALNEDFIEAKKARIAAEARYNELAAGSGEAIADNLSGGVVSELRSDLLQKRREYQAKLETFKEDWPEMVQLKAEIDKGQMELERLIDQQVGAARREAQGDMQTARRREQALEQEIVRQRASALEEQTAAVEYANTQMEVTTLRDLYDQLLRRQSESAVTTSLQATGQNNNVLVIEWALKPGGPSSPVLRRFLIFGLMAGLALGVGAVVVIEYLDRTIKTSDEAERLLGLPTLAVIPDTVDTGKGYGYGYAYAYGGIRRVSGERRASKAISRETGQGSRRGDGQKRAVSIELVPHTKPRLAISEAYRSLRTALLLSTAEELKVVAVTSAEVGEGKTTTAANLAVVLAQLGQQVLLIDGDLRKPRQHDLFGVSRRSGLVSYLTGRTGWESAFVQTDIPNLFLCPSGPLPPNPAELLSSARMRELVKALRGKFGFIVIDTPPVLAVTDATVVGSMADGVLLCLRAGKVLREEAKSCRDRLRLSEIRILGTVLNRHQGGAGRYGRRYHPYEGYGDEATVETSADSAA